MNLIVGKKKLQLNICRKILTTNPRRSTSTGGFGGVTGNTFWEYMGNMLFHKYTEYQ